MDRYDLALLSLLRTLLSKKGSAVLADRQALPGAVAEILAERSNDDIRGPGALGEHDEERAEGEQPRAGSLRADSEFRGGHLR